MVNDIGTKIKVMLTYRGMTMADLARRLHVSKSSVSDKTKNGRWTVSDLEAIAEILESDLRVNFVMRDSGQEI